MRRFVFPLLLLWLFGATAVAAPAPVVLVLGDSLSAGYGLKPGEGWVALLERRLRDQGYGHRVVNASITGETSAGALQRLPRALQRHRPAIVVLELGANDGLRGLPLTELHANLRALITRSRAAGAQVLLVGVRIPTNYGKPYAEKFYALFPQLARDERVAFVPFLLEGFATRMEFFQDDGLHPNRAAQPVVLDNVWRGLKPLLKR
jgi:acyl-CoA thioesterase I